MEDSMSAIAEVVSAKKNTGKRQGKASKQKHNDAFREKKGAAELAKIHAAAAKRTFADLDLEAGLELLSKLHISQSRTEAQVPATTRAVGFISAQVIQEAEATANRAVQNTGITAPIIYRTTLSQVAVQQSIAVKEVIDLQDEHVAPFQPERLPSDFAAEVLTTKKTFSVLSHVVNSFGLLKHGARSFRTYVPPQPTREIPMPIGDGAARRALPARQLLPNPYRVTIQNLRETVLALANVETPQEVRAYFRLNNPIPGAIWDGDVLMNPDELCVDNYVHSDMFNNDMDVFRRFVSSVGTKMSGKLSECRFDGFGNIGMLVSAEPTAGYRLEGLMLRMPGERVYRSQYELSDQQFIGGALSLIGENDPEAQQSFRDPTLMTSRIEMSWTALIRSSLQTKG